MIAEKGYKQLVQPVDFELEIKKSRFLARCTVATNKAAAMDFTAHWRQTYPDARHHCWAYCIGNPEAPAALAQSDDGEPSGTAGKPILSAIQGKGFGNIAVTVIRYFGGVKLGAGGLVRAYSGATAKALDQAETVIILPEQALELYCEFGSEQKVRHWINAHQGKITAVEYSQEVKMQVVVGKARQSEFTAFANAHGIRFRLL